MLECRVPLLQGLLLANQWGLHLVSKSAPTQCYTAMDPAETGFMVTQLKGIISLANLRKDHESCHRDGTII
jgi:hypothetical protein